MGLSYDGDARQRRALLGLTSWAVVFIIMTFVFAGAWRLYVGPYTDFKILRHALHKKAKVTLSQPTCNDPFVRAQVEGFNKCDEAERILALSPTVWAFYDLMDSLAICRNGVCTVAGINISDSLWTVAHFVMIGACVLYVASFFGLITSTHGRNVAYYQSWSSYTKCSRYGIGRKSNNPWY